MKTHYDVLGVKATATPDDIKAAYRRLARQHHPDAPHGSTGTFQALGEAYSILSHPEKRKKYDHLLTPVKPKPQKSSTPPPKQPQPQNHKKKNEEEGASLWSAFLGKKNKPSPFAKQHNTIPLDLPVSTQQCQTGAKIIVPWKEGKSLKITLPKGAQTGDLLKMETSEGPLIARIIIIDTGDFNVQGADIQAVMSLSLSQAILGATLEVPTVHGIVSLKIPPHTSSHRVFRLKGKGLKQHDGVQGDHFITTHIDMPTKMDPELMAFMAKWRG